MANDALDFQAFMRRVEDLLGLRTQVQLAAYLDIRQSSISDAKRRGSIPEAWLLTMITKNMLNPGYMLTGEGSKYLSMADAPGSPVEWTSPEPTYDPETVIKEFAKLWPPKTELRVAINGVVAPCVAGAEKIIEFAKQHALQIDRAADGA